MSHADGHSDATAEIPGAAIAGTEITVNGDPKTVPAGTTFAGLLSLLELDPKYLAVERNLELVPRRTHAEEIVRPGDQIEIVTLVGGG